MVPKFTRIINRPAEVLCQAAPAAEVRVGAGVDDHRGLGVRGGLLEPGYHPVAQRLQRGWQSEQRY